MIDCITLSTNHLFDGNPLASMHRLRYKSIIKRQGWDVPHFDGMEFDQYDNPAATYLVWRDHDGIVRGANRFCPTNRPYMLKDVFPKLATDNLPDDEAIVEGTRFCVDETLPAADRQRIVRELIVAYLEYGLDHGIRAFVGVMYPIYWRNIFTKAGWEIDYLGPLTTLETGERVQAGLVHVSAEILAQVREITGIHDRIINYGAEIRRKAA